MERAPELLVLRLNAMWLGLLGCLYCYRCCSGPGFDLLARLWRISRFLGWWCSNDLRDWLLLLLLIAAALPLKLSLLLLLGL